ncbi:MAG: amino acid permease [Hyphomicrobiales bacterium]
MPEQTNKFKTFGGVFTPSILTILGVIMYLRLGWVVGQSGLISTIGIILIAHIISVSTGLSISSIATDKKVKAGGIYYMLSRSLGLPMGGAIGIALFIGTALSISLYVVGFTESFLSFDYIRDFFGLSTDITSFRIVGTIILIIIGFIAFASTSAAIKTQYFILAAIFLSLVSIFIGFFISEPNEGVGFILTPFKNGLSMEAVFAIFFPAVTGFTAGVAMSGDLKDPKRSIPKGTILAIMTGLIVYILLAFSLSYFVDRDTLLNDSNFLSKIAYVPVLVIIGVWGATLSSALGGILGAPRILQAISTDRITPKIFGKGHGKSNEPRNALILTLILAELGILIGELDAIARVVSMFYIAAYGFINLSFTLEKWASSDFRPTFKVSIWIGIIGFISSFAVMFKLDTVAMIAALIILFLIYFYIKKKKLSLDFGDVWQSVFRSIARTVLTRMDKRKVNERNWSPNIMLFTGDSQVRTHLIDFGKNIIGKQGFISNFDLIENRDAKILFPKRQKGLHNSPKKDEQGVFIRQQECKDIYKGIETIASTYGFSGVDPNTILLGWARQTKEPVKFAKLLKSLEEIDLNIMILDYDQEKGFGERKNIDLWWRGGGNNSTFILSIAKFMQLSETWENTKLRLMIINPINKEFDQLLINGKKILESLRIKGEVRIINNEIEQRNINDIIKSESSNSDLTFLGLPNVIEGKEEKFIESTNKLSNGLGSVVLVKASSYFKELKIGTSGLNIELTKELETFQLGTAEKLSSISINFPKKPDLLAPLEKLYNQLEEINSDLFQSYLNDFFTFQLQIIDEIKNVVSENYNNLIEKNKRYNQVLDKSFLIKNQMSIAFKVRRMLKNFDSDTLTKQEVILSNGVKYYLESLKTLIDNIPDKIVNNIIPEELIESENDSTSTKRFKRRYRRKALKKGSISYDIHFKNFVLNYFPQNNYHLLKEIIEEIGFKTYQINLKALNLSREISSSFFAINSLSEVDLYKEIEKEKIRLEKLFESHRDFCKSTFASLNIQIKVFNTSFIKSLNKDLEPINANDFLENKRSNTSERKEELNSLLILPEKWLSNQRLNNNSIILEWTFIAFILKLSGIFEDAISHSNHQIFNPIQDGQDKVSHELIKIKESINNNSPFNINISVDSVENIESFDTYWRAFFDNSYKLVKLATRHFPEKATLINPSLSSNYRILQFKESKPLELRISLLVDYIIQNEIFASLRNEVFELPNILQKSYVLSQNIIKQILFSIEEEKKNSKTKYIKGLIKEKENELLHEVQNINNAQNKLAQNINQHIRSVTSHLNITNFLNNADSLKIYIKEQEKNKKSTFLKRIQKNIKSNIGYQITQFWYKKGISYILAKSIKGLHLQKNISIKDLIDISESLQINPELQKEIPYYYQQLFSRKQYYLNDFWVGREKEINEAIKTFNRYKAGNKGALLIIGENNSGKSFFSQYISQKFTKNSNIFTISPPNEGSISLSVFQEVLKRSLETYEVDDMFDNIPDNSVIIFDDLELWWEKSKNGSLLIEEISKLINKYCEKHLFIVNINKHSYKLINSLTFIDTLFINKITLDHFHTKELQEAILRRHNSSGKNIIYKNKKQEKLHSWNYARLFSSFFSFSHGNIGIALHAWTISIEKVEKDYITIKTPKKPNSTALENLEVEWYIILSLFILHKRVSISKLSRISLLPLNEVINIISSLKRAGLVTDFNKNIYEINPSLYLIIRDILVKKEIL